mmetsp:Transcript_5437/g.11813  ORF Transcript_5437/g.11813 Transcript_5437/m.11813 type:complete len:279 (+) Transcript_5437:1695-2531(+)
MSKVIVWINAPSFPSMGVGSITNAICHQIVHVRVGALKIHLQTKRQCSLIMQTQLHLFKKLQIPLHGRIAVPSGQYVGAGDGRLHVGILPHRGRRAATFREVALRLHLRLGHVADVRQSPANQLHGELVKRLEVVRRVGRALGRPPQPLQVPPQRIDVLGALGVGVGVVVTEDCAAVLRGHAELFECEAEVHVHGLCVTDVEVPVWLRGEAGAYDAIVNGGVFGQELRAVLGPFEVTGGEGVARGRLIDRHGFILRSVSELADLPIAAQATPTLILMR